MSLPSYRYVPGINPHPLKNPLGHSYGATAHFPFNSNWEKDIGWLRGLDFFDHRFYWEAHEVWEAQWVGLPNGSALRFLLQGMIKASASILKREMSHHRPAELLWTSAKELFTRAGSERRGIDLNETVSRIQRYHEGGDIPLIAGGRP